MYCRRPIVAVNLVICILRQRFSPFRLVYRNPHQTWPTKKRFLGPG
ncbi:hypothetical protein THTE_3599 [Thermogutta terrifontis]|uniref:Uncharacterized protein n=1 Tax=Thermogutta terrifontis TaxID=1331910 RepID=A0A286RJP8_9BACT|nr:hypothetical protein THTE_3599 [Thermogutta terrifontis]